jgi:hypothetical protein
VELTLIQLIVSTVRLGMATFVRAPRTSSIDHVGHAVVQPSQPGFSLSLG